MFKTPKELGISTNDGLNRAIGFVSGKMERREFRFSVGYTEKQYTTEIKKLLRDKNWKLEEITTDTGGRGDYQDYSVTHWQLTPLK